MKKSFLYLLVTLAMFNCEDATKKINFSQETLDNSYDSNIKVSIIQTKNKNAINDKINKLIRDSITSNINQEVKLGSVKDALDSFNKEYVNFKEDFPDSEGVWELSVESELVYQSNEVITISLNIYSYSGGAHGNDKIILLNIDPESGTILRLDDLFTNLNEFKSLSEAHFIESLEQDNKGLSIEDYFYGEPFHLPENIGYSEDGIIMLYNVYEIASYSQGYTEFNIPFDEAESYLKRL